MSTIKTKTFSPYIDWKLCILFGILSTFIVVRFINASKPKLPQGSTIRISGRVSSEPNRYSNAQRVVVESIPAYIAPIPEISYGDNVVIEGVFKDGKIQKGKVSSIQPPKNLLYTLRNKVLSFYKSALPDPHAGLIAGVTLGSKSEIPFDFWEALKSTGTAHVVVASGMNVTLVAKFVLSLTLFVLSRKRAVAVSLIGIWLYCFLAGLEAPIVRAGVMGSIAFSAQVLGRVYSAWRALIFSVLLMLLLKPLWLTDMGFILSFVATASLMLFERKINTLIHFLPSVFREGLSTSLAAQIGVAPILYVTFGQLNPLSPLVNALVLWTIAPLTIISLIAGVFGLVVPLLGKLLLWIVYPLSFWFVNVVTTFS